ncbi:MAG TPA: GNAT family N-acetyltransferase [Abditibacteriaceae bacterium]|jgi:putative acetyltransferase
MVNLLEIRLYFSLAKIQHDNQMSDRFADILIRPATNSDASRIKALVFGVLAEYGLTPDSQTTDADLDDIEGNYIKSGGLFELFENSQGQLLGTVALYRVDDETCELRKMYLAPGARGQGLGSAILERTIAGARCRGFKYITLETAGVLKEAIQLYTRFGFREIESEHLSARCDQAYVLRL